MKVIVLPSESSIELSRTPFVALTISAGSRSLLWSVATCSSVERVELRLRALHSPPSPPPAVEERRLLGQNQAGAVTDRRDLDGGQQDGDDPVIGKQQRAPSLPDPTTPRKLCWATPGSRAR